MSRIRETPEVVGTETRSGDSEPTQTGVSTPRLVRVWASATLVGVLFGFVEALVKATKLAAGKPDPMRYDILYVVPLWYGIVAAAYASLALAVWWLLTPTRFVARPAPWLARATNGAPLVIAVGPVAFVLFGAVLRIYFSTAAYAEALLAAGVAIQTIRIFASRPALLDASLRLLPAAAALTLVLALVVGGGRQVTERSAIASLPQAPSGAPNVLFITLDTLRADHLGAYGSARPTPSLDRLAAESTLFEYAIAPSSWTLPSHASMFTGRRVSDHLAEMNTGERLDGRYPTVAEVFARNGYATAAFVANQEYAAANRGFGRGFLHYQDLFHNLRSAVGETQFGRSILDLRPLGGVAGRRIRMRKTAEAVTEEFFAWLPSRGERPFFAWLNYIDVHDPYHAPRPFDRKYGAGPANGIQNWWYHPRTTPVWSGAENPADGKVLADAYDCALAYLDASVGRLHDALREGGLLENTVVVVTSDHGEAFGEHGIYDHANSLFLESLHVPLFIRYPARLTAGSRFPDPVDLCDLPATMLDLARVPNDGAIPGTPIDGQGDGVAVSELLHNPYLEPIYQVAHGDMFSIVTREWHAIFFVGGAHLFARSDAREQTDLAATDQGKVVLDDLRRMLALRVPGRPIPE